MTTSKLPWTTQHQPDNSAVVLDALGNTIGAFTDHRNADKAVDHVNEHDREVSDLRDKIEELKAIIEEREDDIRELEEQ